MPWSAADADRHMKGLSAHKKKAWAEIANNALKEYGDEGRAIRTANSKVKRVGKAKTSGKTARAASKSTLAKKVGKSRAAKRR